MDNIKHEQIIKKLISKTQVGLIKWVNRSDTKQLAYKCDYNQNTCFELNAPKVFDHSNITLHFYCIDNVQYEKSFTLDSSDDHLLTDLMHLVKESSNQTFLEKQLNDFLNE